jgi:DUF1365 family protein
VEVNQFFKPQIIFGRVSHKRLFPKVNAFNYGIYYLSLPLSQINQTLENKYFKYNRWGFLSFYDKDHGSRDSDDLRKWAQNILTLHDVKNADGEIVLVTMPRVFGYVFNPVSFWYCHDKAQKLRAVICEVNNTFDQTHSYICAHDDGREITGDDIMTGQKVFHVSPFMEREGNYRFRFSQSSEKLAAWIDYYDGEGQKKLLTALSGDYSKLNVENASRAFWRYPLVTFKSIFLIHWQAVKLFAKKCEYVPKPVQNDNKITRAGTYKEK